MINWQDIPHKKSSGKYKTICPACSHERKKKSDPCLSVNADKGLAKCWNCEEVSVRDLKKENYTLPPQEWKNYTELSDKLVKWFRDFRSISQQTLISCGITEEYHYQPALQKEVNNVVFNYFEGGTLVNKKYRTSNKQFTQSANAKKILYGLNDIIGYEEAYIVEGEMDKLAMWEAGIKNCVSVPNGAKDVDGVFENCEHYLKDLKKIYIAVDTDKDGKALEHELLKRFRGLGIWDLHRVEFQGEKDANDLLRKGIMKLREVCENPTPYPVDGTFTAADIKDKLFDYYENDQDATIQPFNSVFKRFNDVFKIMMGQLTVVTGIPSHGKSNWLEWYVINLIQDHNYKASFYSPEHFPMEMHQGVLAEKVLGKPFKKNFATNPKMTKEDLQSYIDWSKDKIYLTYPEKGVSMGWKWLLDKFREQLFRYAIDIFVIDAFNKIKMENPDSLGEINQILSDLCLFAQAHNVHVFLVAHPTKMPKDKNNEYIMPTLYDVKGSSEFRNQAHNGLSIYRHFDEDPERGYTEVVNIKTKFKNQGIIAGRAEFQYDLTNGRYYERGGERNYKPIFSTEETVVKPITKEQIEQAYNDDDLPF